MNYLKKTQFYLFKKKYNYPPILKSNIIKSKFTLGTGNEKILFRSIKVKHGEITSNAYIFNKIAYISDSNDLSIIYKKEFKNLKYLVIDCLKFQKHFSHFNLDEVLYIHQILKPKKTILTNLHSDLDYNFLLKNLPNGIVPAYDGFQINL